MTTRSIRITGMITVRYAGITAFIDWISRKHPEVQSLKNLSEDEFLLLATEFETKGLIIDSKHQNYMEWKSVHSIFRRSTTYYEAVKSLERLTVYGDGSIIVIATIENSFSGLQESKADNATQDLLKELLNEIKALNDKTPVSQTQVVEKMAACADGLITESKNETPDTEWYQLNLEGIKKAALAIGEIATPILTVSEKLSSLLLG